jgi:2-methylcitrate synthase/citrate synthase II
MTAPTYSPGLEGVIAGETSIGCVDQGQLLYRGYPIQELAEKTTFEEVAHLLIYGDLPKAAALSQFRRTLFLFRQLPPQVVQALRLIPTDAPMMDVLRTCVSMAGHFDPVRGNSIDDMRRRAVWLLASVATIVAARYRFLQHKEPVEPKEGLSHAAQILYQCQGVEPDEQSARIIDLTLILYAEHEFNASTFANRICASTLSDMVSCVVCGIGTLKGPLHGGANEEAMKMLKQFKTADDARKWIRNALAKGEKVMGFGHRVYKHGDHRARILDEELRKLARQKQQEHWVEIYDAIKIPMEQEKKIFPNVDYPCGLIYYLMDLPIDIYTPLFVAARVTGWCAHYIEQVTNNRIYRPLSVYTGPPRRPVPPINQR